MTSCYVCLLCGDSVCTHDKNTVLLMRIWLKYRPTTLLEFYIRVYDHIDENINESIKNFIERYNLYE